MVVIGLDKNGYEVLSLNPTAGGIQLMTVWYFIAQSLFFYRPSIVLI